MIIPNEKILILSGELGDGHKQAAHALLEASDIHLNHAEVQVIDFMELVSPHLHNVSKYLYLQSVKKFPSVYGFLYQKTKRPNTLSQMLKKFKVFGINRLLRLLDTYQPTVVVSTFPAAAAAMSMLKSSGMTPVPIVTIITDHTDHSYWLYANTNQYIVGSNHVRQALNRLHIKDSQITVTGIPIRSSFCQTYNLVSLREKYGLSFAKPTILLMGGGCGMFGQGLIDLLMRDVLEQSMQFIIICGHNEKLKVHLQEMLKSSKHTIILKGYVNQVHEFMALSDLLITKPGGLTTSEAIASELPMLLYRPLPGQEQDNAKFLLEAGVAVEAKCDSDLSIQLKQLINHPQLLRRMREKSKGFPMHEAAYKALDAILLAQYSTAPEVIVGESYAHVL